MNGARTRDSVGKGQDLGLDALLNFKKKFAHAAIFDLPALGIQKGSWGDFHGSLTLDPIRVDILTGRRQSANELRGMWLHAGELKTHPPRQLSEVLLCMPRKQRKGLKRALQERRSAQELIPSGGVDLILFCWEWRERTDLLVMACKGTGDAVEAIALQPGANDDQTLILRAGPDAPALRSLKAVVFGRGRPGWSDGADTGGEWFGINRDCRLRCPFAGKHRQTRGRPQPSGQVQGRCR